MLRKVILVFMLLAAAAAAAQVSPFQGLGVAQFFDNNGEPLTSGVLYSFQAGTTTQQATYTDSTGTIQNPNPLPFTTGARATLWLSTGKYYKFVLCLQNDGATCAPGDVLFAVDQVPGGVSGGGGSSSSPFISASANPATSGILRLATADQICWRNAANSANLCISKDGSDVLSWAGGSMKFPEVSCSNAGAGYDYLCADSGAHRWTMSNNGGGQVQIAAAGVDINNSDEVTQLHFGSTPLPLSATAPTSNQYLQFDGTKVVGKTLTPTGSEADYVTAAAAGTTGNCAKWLSTGGIGDAGSPCGVDQYASSAGCTTNAGGGGTCNFTVSWPNAFADTNYYVNCTLTSPSGFPSMQGISGITTTSVTVNIQNGTSNQAVNSSAGAMCHAHHN